MSENIDESYLPTNPIDRLPAELFCRIFRLAVDNDYDPKSSLDTSLCPWTLTGVCRRWRSISIGTPDLWKDIRFTFDASIIPDRSHHGRSRWEIDMELIQLQLKRSDQMTLEIYLNSGYWKWFPYLDDLCAVLRDHHRRWRSFAVGDPEGTAGKLLSIFPSLGQATLPHLERLEILSFCSPKNNNPWNTNVNFFRLDCPKLRCTTFRDTFPYPTAIPWRQIEELTLTNTIPIANTLLPLAFLSNLQRLNLAGLQISETIKEGPAVLPRLEVLDITILDPGDDDPLNFIIAPALHTIRFHPCSTNPMYASHLQQLILHSHCTILSLLIDPILDMASLFDLLAMTPDLKQLDLDIRDTNFARGRDGKAHESIESLAMRMKERLSSGGRFKYCPHLARLALAAPPSSSAPRFNIDAILAMAEERFFDGRLGNLGFNHALYSLLSGNPIIEKQATRLRRGGMVVQYEEYRPY